MWVLCAEREAAADASHFIAVGLFFLLVKLPLCLTEHSTVQTYGGVEV